MLSRALRGVCLIALIFTGCQGGDEAAEDENIVAPEGKDDNFFSNTAQEYLASSTVDILLDESEASLAEDARAARAREIMEGKTRQIGWFLHVYLIDKSSHGASNPAESYGGMRAMVLDGAYTSDALKADPSDPRKFSFAWSVQVGGTKDLLSKIRRANGLSSTENTFPLRMAKLSNSSVAHFSSSGYGAGKWSPETCNCELETVRVKLEAIPPSNDAYLDYSRFLEDGVMDVSLHVGWDYHGRYDISNSREVYQWLVRKGFTSPARSYEEYNRLSGPLTKTVWVNGRDIALKVTIFRPDPCESWNEDGAGGTWAQAVKKDKKNEERSCPDWKWADPNANANPTTSAGAGNLMRDLKDSLRTRDAILFSGHSGYTYGYALGSWFRTSAGDLDPPEIKTLDLPKDKSQLFVMSGCDTYHVAQAIRENPNKKGLVNADVITTTSFSTAGDASDTLAILSALVGDETKLIGHSYGRMMSALNPSTVDNGWGHFTMYGVHGLDDNPLANPLGDAGQTCKTCASDADCGAAGNVCVRLSTSEKVCAVECLGDKGCAADQACRPFGSSSSSYLKGMACVPKTLTCGSTPPPPPSKKEFTASGDLGRSETKEYSIPVGAKAKNVRAVLTGTGDADLYTRFTTRPTTSDYDCRPYKGSSNETCEHVSAKGTTLEVMVRGYSSAGSHFNLKVTWE